MQYADSKEVEAAVLDRFPPKPVPIQFAEELNPIEPYVERSQKRTPKTKGNKSLL